MTTHDMECLEIARPRPQDRPGTEPADGLITVNGVPIDPAAIAQERAQDATTGQAAAQALVIRELLRQRAVEMALIGDDGALDDDIVDALLDREIDTPLPTADDCRRYYDAHPAQFRRNDIVHASHILFAVTARVPLTLLRLKAEETLAQALAAPETFDELARTLSNCPSAAVGGSLGQLLRGDSVPEFDRALFEARQTGILPGLVNSRYGFHIVRIDRRLDGEPAPFDTVRADIAAFLETRVRHKAMQQYIGVLASRAAIEGTDLGAAHGPLVQ